MTARHAVLTVAALAVFGLGVYLFIQVRATPATADVTPPRKPTPPEVAAAEPDPTPDRPIPPPVRRDAAVPASSQDRMPVRPVQNPGAAEVEAQVLPPDVQKIDAIMAEANKAYDRGDFDDARSIAAKVLAKDPSNVRMLRIMVSASCIDGDAAEAQKHYLKLPGPDREQMKIRCNRYGVTFTDS